MCAAFGPGVLDDVADNFIQSDMELHPRLAADGMLHAEASQHLSQNGEIADLVANGDTCRSLGFRKHALL